MQAPNDYRTGPKTQGLNPLIPALFFLSGVFIVFAVYLKAFPTTSDTFLLSQDFFFLLTVCAFGAAVGLTIQGLDHPPKMAWMMVIGASFVIISQCLNVLDEIEGLNEVPAGRWVVENSDNIEAALLYPGLLLLFMGATLLLLEFQRANSRMLDETQAQFREMDERRRASEILSAQTKVLDTSAEGYVILDSQRKVAWVSRRMEKMFGLDRDRTNGTDGTEFVRKLLGPSFDQPEQYVGQILSSYSKSEECKLLVRLLPDESRAEEWLEYHSLPIESGLYAGGRIEHYKDITELKRAETALLSASRIEATATLAGGVAHDFNNLMVAVMGNAELLKEDLGDNPTYDAMLGSIIHAADRAGYLATQMLNFARGGGFYPKSINLNETIREVLKFRAMATPAGIVIDFVPNPDLWPIWADPAQIHEVLNNLLNNAIEAIELEGTIRIRLVNEKDETLRDTAGPRVLAGRFVKLTVEDDGVGMDTQTRARVFEPFFTTKFQGRGIGLASAYGIVRTHKGHITVQSEKNKGTSFGIHFPAHETQPEKKASGEGGGLQDGRPTILIVDDEGVVVEVTQRILQSKGYHVLTANSGEEGLEICKEHPGAIDLAILDVAMPTMGAIETFPLLKEHRPDTKVLLFSGYEMDTSVKDLLAAGADSFLRKPVRSEVLLNEIARILEVARVPAGV
jgi:signal transduction histidine kinase/ActR/RegA family two-component response regulator